MSSNRKASNLVHIKDGTTHKLSKSKIDGKFFIRGTDIEIPSDKIKQPKNNGAKKKSNYDFSKPSQAQGLGDEWDHYAWSADDF